MHTQAGVAIKSHCWYLPSPAQKRTNRQLICWLMHVETIQLLPCVLVTAILFAFMSWNTEIQCGYVGSITCAWLARLFFKYKSKCGRIQRKVKLCTVCQCVCVPMPKRNCVWSHFLYVALFWHVAISWYTVLEQDGYIYNIASIWTSMYV